MKYKHILVEENAKIVSHIKRNVEQFDNEVSDLFETKMKYDLAISQEYLKIIRLMNVLDDSDKRKDQILQHEYGVNNCISCNSLIIFLYYNCRMKILEAEKTIEEINEKIATTEETYSSLLNTVDVLKQKHNLLQKRFKSESPSKIKFELASIPYK